MTTVQEIHAEHDNRKTEGEEKLYRSKKLADQKITVQQTRLKLTNRKQQLRVQKDRYKEEERQGGWGAE